MWVSTNTGHGTFFFIDYAKIQQLVLLLPVQHLNKTEARITRHPLKIQIFALFIKDVNVEV